jgi:beta-N-acetylhexosaminidase
VNRTILTRRLVAGSAIVLLLVVIVLLVSSHDHGAATATTTTASSGRTPARASTTTPHTTTTTPAPRPTTTVSVRKLIGQKIMVGFRGQAVPPLALLAAIRTGKVGGVILFSENTGDAQGYAGVVQKLQHAAAAGHNPPLLISIDQEGGTVRRIANAPPTESAAAMGAAGPHIARAQGVATGKALHKLGINVDLAPVSDVPDSPSTFLGSRAFGTRVPTVGAAATAFASGLQSVGVAATAKHYPGLGTIGLANTDTSVVTVKTSLGELTARAKPFHQVVAAGARLVMVSNAIYPTLDPSAPAVLSRTIVTDRLRKFLENGVIISDGLEVPVMARYGSRVPVLASRAGVDILLYADTNARGAFDTMLAANKHGQLPTSVLQASYRRIVALKRWVSR